MSDQLMISLCCAELASRCGVSEMQFNKLLQSKEFCAVRVRIRSIHRSGHDHDCAIEWLGQTASLLELCEHSDVLEVFSLTDDAGWTPIRKRTGSFCIRFPHNEHR